MSSLIKSLAFAGLASEANAMLLKKVGCNSNGVALADVGATDLCGALQYANGATKKTTLAKGSKDKTFTLQADGDDTAKEFDCTEVDKCDIDTGKAPTSGDGVKADVDKVKGGWTSDTAKPTNIGDLTTFCGGGQHGATGKDMCGLYKLAAAATAKPTVVNAGDDDKVKVDTVTYDCKDVAKCNKTTGLVDAANGEKVGPTEVDGAYSTAGQAPDISIVNGCKKAAATVEDQCALAKALNAKATAIEPDGTSKHIKVTFDGQPDVKLYDCVPFEKCQKSTGVKATAGNGDGTVDPWTNDVLAKAKGSGGNTNTEISVACTNAGADAWTQPATKGSLCYAKWFLLQNNSNKCAAVLIKPSHAAADATKDLVITFSNPDPAPNESVRINCPNAPADAHACSNTGEFTSAGAPAVIGDLDTLLKGQDKVLKQEVADKVIADGAKATLTKVCAFTGDDNAVHWDDQP